MADRLACIVLMAAIAVSAGSAIGQSREEPDSIEARVSALETDFARLDTRFELLFAQLNAVREGADDGLATPGDRAMIDRDIDRLSLDVQRLQRLADAAQREAARALRVAESAERLARQAQTRAR